MANSQYEYVRKFEQENLLLPKTYIVIRVDGRGFHGFSRFYNFAKPNDMAAINVMTQAAAAVFKNVSDLFLAYGDSDEFSFVFERDTTLFERRESKLVSTVVSTFTAHYVAGWSAQFPDRPLDPEHMPSFDGRAVVYPSIEVLRDYFAWRQVDCHINNLYNTTFWALVERGGRTPQEAEQELCGTVSSDKNEILFSQFGINYNNEPEVFKKGTVIRWKQRPSLPTGTLSTRQLERYSKKRSKAELELVHCDIIKDPFWEQYR